MPRDINSTMKWALVTAPAVITATPEAPPEVALAGYNGHDFAVFVGGGGITFTTTNKIGIKVEHKLPGASAYTACTADDLVDVLGHTIASDWVITNGVIKEIVAAHATPALYPFGYVGPGTHVKITTVLGGTHATGTLIGILGHYGHPDDSPARA